MPIVNGIVSGVGAAIGVKALSDTLAKASVIKRTEKEIRSVNIELLHVAIEEQNKLTIPQLGEALTTTHADVSLTTIYSKHYENLRNYLNNNPGMISRYIRAVAERSVALAAHDTVEMTEVQKFLESHVQGIAALIAIKNGAEFITEEHVKKAQEELDKEIQSASKKGKWYTALRWFISAIVGIVTGWFAWFKSSEATTSANKTDASSTTNSQVETNQSAITQHEGVVTPGIIDISTAKSDVQRLIDYMKNNEEVVKNMSFREIVEKAGLQSEEVKQQLIESFVYTGKPIGLETLRRFTGLDPDYLAEHVVRVDAARDSANLSEYQKLLHEVSKGFEEAKQTVDKTDPKWKIALDALKKRLNDKGINVAEGGTHIPKRKIV
ncbi:MAG: hypothetical protein N3E37_00230 [Candidatus Micrarchaeota archaeon]|nr:hypothetical protein [Candidatus Micrarchaeota archaeon]